MWAVIIIVAIIVVLALFLVGIYNGMVRARNRVDEAWSGRPTKFVRGWLPLTVTRVSPFAAA